MARKNSDYWLDRSIEQEQRAEEITTEYLTKMGRRLRDFQRDTIREIDVFYNRYATDHKISKADAIQYLTDNERAEFQNMTLRRYAALAKDPNTSPRLVDALAYRHRISRQEAILAEIELKALELYGNRGGLLDYTYKNLGSVYGQAKLSVARDTAKIGMTLRRPILDISEIKNQLKINWSGKNLSQSIWGHEEKLYDTISNIMDQGFIGEWSQDKIVNLIKKRVDVAESDIERLVRTEQTAYNSLGAAEQMRNHFEEEYEIVAVLDSRTTHRCRTEHGTIYPLSEYQIGKNAPPFHVRCRSSIRSTHRAIDYFTVDENYSGPELDSVFDEWEKELDDVINRLGIDQMLD